MKRRDFMKVAGVGLAAGAAAAPAFVPKKVFAQEGMVKWRITSAFPKSLDTIFGGAVTFSERVKALTDGKFEIQVFAPGEIVPGGPAALDAVTAGTVEACHTATYYSFGKNPCFSFGTAVPFGLNFRQTNSWLQFGGGQELLDEFFADYGVRSFAAGNTGVQMGGWYRKELKTVDDFKGLKLRIAGLAGMVWSGVGAVPQQIPGADIYPALEKGTIDAAEWVGPYDDEKLGFYKVAPYYYAPGWWEVGPVLHVMVSKAAFDKLSPSFQAAVKVAAQDANVTMMASYDAKNPAALARLLKNGVKLKKFSKDQFKAFYQSAGDVYGKISKENATFAKIYASQAEFQKQSSAWLSVAEYPMESYNLPKI